MSNVPRRLLLGAEQKFGHFAIPGLLRWIAIFKLLVYVLQFVSPEMVESLVYNQAKIYQWEVWRLFSYVLIPGTRSPLIMLFILFFLWFINDGLEQAWGHFRVTFYILATLVFIGVFGLLPGVGLVVSIPFTDSSGHVIDGVLTGQVFFASVFLAFASIYPNQIINLLGVIPIKAKWLGLANVGMLIFNIFKFADLAPIYVVFAAIGAVAGLTPYLIVFAPEFLRNLKQASENSARRTAFKEKTETPIGEAFHNCHACGKTDHTDPDLEFRVSGNGEEYCIDCLPSRQDGEVEA